MKKFALWVIVFAVSFMSLIEVGLNVLEFDYKYEFLSWWAILFFLTLILSIVSFIFAIKEAYSKKIS
jgi:hypothetical protein